MTDHLSPTRPGAERAATMAVVVRPAKAAPKPDPVPPPPAAESGTDAAPAWRARLLMFGVPLLLLAGGAGYWLRSGGSVSTDNAYVQMDKVSVSAQVGGLITEVAVREGQQVAKGQLLFRIDGHPYALSVAQANAAIDSAQVDVGNLSASLATTRVDIRSEEHTSELQSLMRT